MHYQPHEYPYEKLSNLKEGTYANFYGQVIEFEPPRPTRGTDMLLRMFVVDETIESTFSQRGALPVQIFKSNLDEFPDIHQIGEIIQFRHLKILKFENHLQALSNRNSRFNVFYQAKDMESREEFNQTSDDSETKSSSNENNNHENRSKERKKKRNKRERAKETKKQKKEMNGNWLSRSPNHIVHSEELKAIKTIIDGYHGLPSSSSTSSSFAIPFSSKTRELVTIHSLKPNMYFDIVLEVLLKINNNNNLSSISSPFAANNGKLGQICLLATDYTKNNLINIDSEYYKLFPSEEYSNMVLHCTFWDNFAHLALTLEPGDIIHLVNMHSQLLEPLNSSIFNSFSSSSSGLVAVMHGDREGGMLIESIHSNPRPHSPSLNKGQLQKISKESNLAHTLLQRKERIRQKIQANLDAISASTLNPTKIEWNYDTITSIETIKTFPEENNKFLIRGKIIDHSPKKFEDFSRLCCSNCFTTILPSSTTAPSTSLYKNKSCSKCQGPSSFIFIFSLVIDDGTDDLAIIICFEDAIKFFNGITAVNLALYPNILSYIKTAIETLEKSSIPSLFCIKSYKIVNQVTGESEMRYRVFDTILNQVFV